MIRIGIPRGLLYYQYGRRWQCFLQELGAEVVISSPTSKATLDCGSCLDEVCLPAKVYFGHVCELRSKVDYLFVPRVVSVAKGQYTCPKIIGMPDLLRSNIADLPQIVDVNIDLRQQRSKLLQAIVQVGQLFNKGAVVSIAAWCRALRQRTATPESPAVYSDCPRVALIGHPYVLYDEQISMQVITRLKKFGLDVVTPEMVEPYDVARAAATLDKQIFWSNSEQMAGAALALIQAPHPVDGLIFLTTFACGPDALIGELIGQYAQSYNIPSMLLSLDEHTAEAGFVTRLEAFTDMLQRRCKA